MLHATLPTTPLYCKVHLKICWVFEEKIKMKIETETETEMFWN